MKTKESGGLDALLKATRPIRDRVAAHSVYGSLETLEQVRVFMENHVFAVWDFMCLVKALQAHLTSVSLPWLPKGDTTSRRLINEIVLDEESDENGQGSGYMSHFELYLETMEQCGADTAPIEAFIKSVRHGQNVRRALESRGIPKGARDFVGQTWSVLETNQTHRIAAAFTIGREEIIPDMFQTMIGSLQERFPDRLSRFGYYLDRHIHVDKERHGPMAARMLESLCGTDPVKWREATQAAQTALKARLALWDGVHKDIRAIAPSKANGYKKEVIRVTGGGMINGNQKTVDQRKLMQAQKLISEAFGEDSPEALENSPDRFARWQTVALSDARKAYQPGKVKLYPIAPKSAVELITIKATAYSSCEHHYAPAWLKATIGYHPDKNYAGYSKIVKMFKYFACKYTMDERICNDFLAELNATVKPKGAGIILRGKHFCVISRGGNEADFPMMSALTGSLKTDANLRREFYQHATTSWQDGV